MKTSKRSAPAALTPLRDEELSAVTGGRVQHSDLQISKFVDKASPKLFDALLPG